MLSLGKVHKLPLLSLYSHLPIFNFQFSGLHSRARDGRR